MRSTRLALVATNVAAVVAVLALPGAASATETRPNVCPEGYFCAYPKKGWEGRLTGRNTHSLVRPPGKGGRTGFTQRGVSPSLPPPPAWG